MEKVAARWCAEVPDTLNTPHWKCAMEPEATRVLSEEVPANVLDPSKT